MPVPTEWLRHEYIYKLEKRCNNCPYSDTLQNMVEKRLPPCDKCKVKWEKKIR